MIQLIKRHSLKFIIVSGLVFVGFVGYWFWGGKPFRREVAYGDPAPAVLHSDYAGYGFTSATYSEGGSWVTVPVVKLIWYWWNRTVDTTINLYRSTSESGPFTLIADNSYSYSCYDSVCSAGVFSDTDFVPGATNYYEITYTANGVTSPMSNIVSVVVPPLPSVVTGVTATTLNYSSVQLGWDASSACDSPTYLVYRGDSADGNFSAIASGIATNSYTDSSASASTTYYYKVSAKCLVGEGPQSASASATTWEYINGPATVSAILATDNSKVTLTWSPVEGVSEYQVVRTGGVESSVTLGTTASSTFVDNASGGSFPLNTRYNYSVYPLGAHGASGSTAATVYTPETPPAAPQNVGVNAIDNNNIGIWWDWVSLVNGSATYNIYKSDSAEGPFVLYKHVNNNCNQGAYRWDSNCKVTDLNYNTPYYFKVSAVTSNTQIEGVLSDAVNTTTLNNAMVTTNPVTDITTSTVTFHGTVEKLDAAGDLLPEIGFQYNAFNDFNQWGNYDNTTISLQDGSYGVGSFSAPFTNLTPGNLYYYRTYIYDPGTGARTYGTSRYLITPVEIGVENPTLAIVFANTPTTLIKVPTIGTGAKLDFANFYSKVDDTETKVSVPRVINTEVNTDLGVVSLQLPANSNVACSSTDWNGVIDLPTTQATTTVNVVPGDGKTAKVTAVVEVGSAQYSLSLDKSARLLIPGQAGKNAGYSINGGEFHSITTTCDDDSQTAVDAQVGAGQECRIDVGNDLAIWTRHFTKFVAYEEQVANSSSAYRNAAGVQRGIDDDNAAPTSTAVIINEGREQTTTSTVLLNLNAQDENRDPIYMRISNNNYFNDQSWVPYVTSTIWQLDPGEGKKTVYVQFRDVNYNISAIVSDSITLVTGQEASEGNQTFETNTLSTFTIKVEKELSKVVGQETGIVFSGLTNKIYQPGEIVKFAYKILNPFSSKKTVSVKRQLVDEYGKVVASIKGAFRLGPKGSTTKYVTEKLSKNLKPGNYQQTIEVRDSSTGKIMSTSSLPLVVQPLKHRMVSSEPYINNSSLVQFNATELEKIVDKRLPFKLKFSFTYTNPQSVKNGITLVTEIIREGNGQVIYKTTKKVSLEPGEKKNEVLTKQLTANQTTGRYIVRVRMYDESGKSKLGEESTWFNIEVK